MSRYTVPCGDPGTFTPGVNILMESFGLGIASGNPVGGLFPLTNDDYGTRQFLYPSAAPVPEPATVLLLGTGLAAVAARRRQKTRAGLR